MILKNQKCKHLLKLSACLMLASFFAQTIRSMEKGPKGKEIDGTQEFEVSSSSSSSSRLDSPGLHENGWGLSGNKLTLTIPAVKNISRILEEILDITKDIHEIQIISKDNPKRERLAGTDLERLGRLFPSTGILQLNNLTLRDRELHGLVSNFPSLTKLYLDGNKGISSVQKLKEATFAPKLKVISVNGTNVTESENELKNIFPEAEITMPTVTDESLHPSDMWKIKENKLTLSISATKDINRVLEKIKKKYPTTDIANDIHEIQITSLYNPTGKCLTGKDLEIVGKLFPHVTTLKLTDLALNNLIIRNIANTFPHLAKLNLSNSSGITTLEQLKDTSLAQKLQELAIGNTDINPSKVAQLREIFPNATIRLTADLSDFAGRIIGTRTAPSGHAKWHIEGNNKLVLNVDAAKELDFVLDELQEKYPDTIIDEIQIIHDRPKIQTNKLDLTYLGELFPEVTTLRINNLHIRTPEVNGLSTVFPNLTALHLDDNPITTLEELESAPFAHILKMLTINNTNINPSEVAQLKDIFPNATISFTLRKPTAKRATPSNPKTVVASVDSASAKSQELSKRRRLLGPTTQEQTSRIETSSSSSSSSSLRSSAHPRLLGTASTASEVSNIQTAALDTHNSSPAQAPSINLNIPRGIQLIINRLQLAASLANKKELMTFLRDSDEMTFRAVLAALITNPIQENKQIFNQLSRLAPEAVRTTVSNLVQQEKQIRRLAQQLPAPSSSLAQGIHLPIPQAPSQFYSTS